MFERTSFGIGKAVAAIAAIAAFAAVTAPTASATTADPNWQEFKPDQDYYNRWVMEVAGGSKRAGAPIQMWTRSSAVELVGLYTREWYAYPADSQLWHFPSPDTTGS